MNKQHASVASFLLVCLVVCFAHAKSDIKTVYLTSYCNSILKIGSPAQKVNSSRIVRFAAFNSYPPQLKCSVQLVPDGTSGVILSVRKIEFRQNCQDSITISDVTAQLIQKFCGYMESSDEVWSYSTNGPMNLTFQSGISQLSTIAGGFEFTITAFRSTPCQSSDFKCKNNRCIWDGLKCDGHNHCGDNSDQKCGMSVGGIVGTVFGCIFLIVAIVAGYFYCRSRRTVITYR